MWQRIHTLYLLIATVLIGLMFFLDKADGVKFISYFPYLIFLIVITLLNIIALMVYKFRIPQMRTALFSAIVTIFFQIWIVVDYFFISADDVIFKLPAVFPVVAVILDFLAARSIFADELIVRSASRLRAAKRKHKK